MTDHNDGHDELTPKEIRQAASALCRWFGSQDMEPAAAIPVMVDVSMRIIRRWPQDQQRECIEHVIACYKALAETTE